MKKIIFIALLLLAALVQSALIPYVSVFGVKPDLFWIMVMCAALYFDAGTAVIFSLTCGLLKDCLGTSPFGVYIVLFPLWSIGIGCLSKRISFDNMPVSSFVLGAMVFVNAVALRFMPFIPDGPLSFTAFMRIGVIESIYTALVFAWIGPLVRRLAESRRW
ncbi:MAG: rod shape-determining protein MreD [Candidatus Omnitrophota bacterium]